MYLRIAPMFLVENVDQAVEWYKGIFKAKLQATYPKILPLNGVHFNLETLR